MKMVTMNMKFVTVLLLVLSGCQPRFCLSSSRGQSGVKILCSLPLHLGCWTEHGLLLGEGASCGRRRAGVGGRTPAGSR